MPKKSESNNVDCKVNKVQTKKETMIKVVKTKRLGEHTD